MKAASLNHIYRLVWSRLQQAWVAVAETARTQGKSSVSGNVVEHASAITTARHVGAITCSAKRGLLVASALAAAMAPFTSYADSNVVAGVVAGDLTIKDLSSTQTQYTHTANVNIVDFYKFGVEKGHQLDVVMPDAGRALYRVIGDSRSEIMGTLNSNGSLFLINQNGVLFGNGSEVNVGNIVASSLNITNDNFLKGNYSFAAGAMVGNVENYGVIKAKNEGYIVLLGKTVDNSGTLVASNGSVVLGSAQQATLDFFGNGLVKTKLSGGALEATIKNSGAIYADGGFVQMATNARASAINISGIVEANQLVERNGVIRLEGGDNAKVQVSGQLLAKGLNTTGGTIEVTGEQVALMNGALLDASGDKGGGKVLVGGDYQGKNDAVYNARTTYVASGATIKADAIQEGNGGKVVVWADDLTRYYGDISAQGAAAKGNGGFVEVSGKQYLAMLGDVNVGAANGIGGSILFDPENITLDNTAPTPLTDQATGTPDVAFADNSGVNTVINISNVQGFTELFLQANNDITVKSPISMTLPNGSIRMEANNNINVNANIQSGPIGSISLTADKDGKNGGDININANITSGSGGVFLSAAKIAVNQPGVNINTTGNIFNGIAGSVKMEATGDINLGNANINAAGAAVGPGTGANGGNVEIKANSLTMTGNINTSGSVSNQTLGSGGQGGVVTINTVNNLTVGSITTSAGDAGSTSASSTLSGDVTLASSAGNITTANVNANGGVNNLGAKVTMNAAGEIKTGDINTSAGAGRSDTDGKSAGDINITAGTNLTVGKVTASGADGNGTNKSGGVAGAVNLVATTGDVTFGGITNNAGAKTGTGVNGNSANIFVRAGKDIIQKGNIVTTSNSADAVTMVASVGYKNTNNFDISTGSNGRWLIYSQSPDVGQRGSKILNGYDFKQYGTSYDAVKNGSQQINAAAKGNGLIYSETIVIDPKVSGTATKVYDTTTDASIAGLDLVKEGRDNDVINYSKLVSATYDNKNVGDNKVVTTNPVSIVSVTNTGFRNGVSVVRQVYGYTLTNNQTSVAATGAVGKITPATVSTVAGITANDKVFDGNTLATLNTGAAIFNGRLGSDQLTVATADGQFIDSAVGTGKTVNISAITLGGVDAGNYILADNTATTTASILAVPTTPTAPTTLLNISPRDNAGLGGLVGTNPALNTMTIVSLNPAAGDDEDPDAVACPVNEDHLGSTPILSSGVKLPDGVNSNCI